MTSVRLPRAAPARRANVGPRRAAGFAAFGFVVTLLAAGGALLLARVGHGPRAASQRSLSWRRAKTTLGRAAGLAALVVIVALVGAAAALVSTRVDERPLAGASPPDEAPQVTLGTKATLDSLERPLDVAVDAEGRLYVLGGRGQRWVWSFDPSGKPLSAFEVPGTPGGLGPAYLAVGPDGLIYIGDRASASVLVFDGEGRMVRQLTSPLNDGWLPLGVAFDAAGNLYVTDVTPGRHRVVKLGGYGKVVWTVGSQGSGPAQFSFPSEVTVDGQGRVYVSDSNNGRVQVLDASGAFLQVLPEGDRSLDPRGLALDGTRLYVVSTSRHEILVYDVSAEPRLVSSPDGSASLGLRYPNGATVGLQGRLYVADRGSNRVAVVEP